MFGKPKEIRKELDVIETIISLFGVKLYGGAPESVARESMREMTAYEKGEPIATIPERFEAMEKRLKALEDQKPN